MPIAWYNKNSKNPWVLVYFIWKMDKNDFCIDKTFSNITNLKLSLHPSHQIQLARIEVVVVADCNYLSCSLIVACSSSIFFILFLQIFKFLLPSINILAVKSSKVSWNDFFSHSKESNRFCKVLASLSGRFYLHFR